MKITDTIRYAGVNDHQIDLFEGQYKVPNGMAYNSYVILDEKIAVMDTVDANFTHEWLDNLDRILEGRKPDYLIVQHMEPDPRSKCGKLPESLSGNHHRSQRENLHYDPELLRSRPGRTEAGGYKWRHPQPWKPQPDLCFRSHGALAGSYGNL